MNEFKRKLCKRNCFQ